MTRTIREIVAVFDNIGDLERAVCQLETTGFDRAAFSLLASEHAIEEKLGHRYQTTKEMEDNPTAKREAFFSHVSRLEAEYLPTPILASIGALALTGAGTLAVLSAAGAGAILGAALGLSLHKHEADRVAEQLARGGLLLWINVRDREEEKTALQILRTYPSHDVHVHTIAMGEVMGVQK